MSLAALLNLCIFLVGLAIVTLGLLLCRGRRRSGEPTCPKCGYALRGLPGVEREGEAYEPVPCPECGHAAARRINLFRRQRRPAWLGLVAVGIGVLCEPLYFGTAYDIYDHLPDSAIVRLHAQWNDRYAGWVVEDRIRTQMRSAGVAFRDDHMLTLAEGAIARIEHATTRGVPDTADPIDLLILIWLDAQQPAIAPPAFASRIARAMPPLIAHPDDTAHAYAAWLSRDPSDPASTVAAVVDAHDDPDPRVRAAAAISLFGHLRHGQDVAAPFVALLNDTDADVRVQAAIRLRQHAERFALPTCLEAPLRAIEPESTSARRARDMALLATLHGDEQVDACRARLREGSDDQRREALRFVSHRPALIAALLPQWGKARRGPIEYWLQAQRHRPIDEILEDLGFE
jgi:predicted RNA-binding Zn-ribbon protein involved in translation (DUF1610 family)